MSVDTSTLTMPKNGEITDTTYVFSCDPYLTEADQEAAIADAGMDMTYLPIEENAYLILGGDTSYAIPYCADEPERAMMVLNAIYSQPDLYNTLIYGIEGEDYTKTPMAPSPPAMSAPAPRRTTATASRDGSSAPARTRSSTMAPIPTTMRIWKRWRRLPASTRS